LAQPPTHIRRSLVASAIPIVIRVGSELQIDGRFTSATAGPRHGRARPVRVIVNRQLERRIAVDVRR